MQAEPKVWLTATRQAETFEYAGHKGYNVLTMLMGSSLDELGEKIALYRRARERSGFDPESGVISLMLHTFVHPDGEFVRQQVRDPFHEYISSAISSHAQAAGKDRRQPTREEMDRLAELSFERYSRTAALIGTPQEAIASVRRFEAAGVNEVACLCDFGAPPAAILQSLPHLDAVRRSFVVDEVIARTDRRADRRADDAGRSSGATRAADGRPAAARLPRAPRSGRLDRAQRSRRVRSRRGARRRSAARLPAGVRPPP